MMQMYCKLDCFELICQHFWHLIDTLAVLDFADVILWGLRQERASRVKISQIKHGERPAVATPCE